MRTAVLALVGLAAGCARVEEEPTNLLLVTMDSVRAEQFAEPERFSTLPLALTAFTEQATRFSHCIASAPETLPAVASILTGRHPRELGHPAPDRALPADVPTLAEVLSQAGFDTAAFVAPATLRERTGIGRGFAHFRAPQGMRDEDYEVTDLARDWLRDPARRERPWFVWVHLNAAHGPYRALETAFNPLNFFNKLHVPAGVGREREIPFATDNSGRGGIPEYQVMSSPGYFGPYVGYYDARVRVGDWFANELRHVLRFTEQYAQTVVAVCATHGEALGEHGVEFDHGENLFREVLEVPLLVAVPGRAPGTVDATVSHVDLFPTLLAALGVESPGSSGLDLFQGGSGVAWSELYPPIGPESAVAATMGARKLVRRGAETLVFDLEHDPREERGAPPGPNDELAARLADFERVPARAVEPLALDARERSYLNALGYVLARFEH